MDYLVLPHFGLGDQLIMNGFVHYVLQTQAPKSITIIADGSYQKKTLEHLYSDYPIVGFLWIPGLHKGPRNEFIVNLSGLSFRSMIQVDSKIYCLLNFGHYS